MIQTYEKNKWQNRLICLFLACALLMPAISTQAEAFSSQYYYTTVDNTMFRPKADTTNYIARLPANWPMEKVGDLTINNELWYEMKGIIPTDSSRERTGWIQANYLRMMTQAEDAAYTSGNAPGIYNPPVIVAPGDENKPSKQAIVTVNGSRLLQTPNGALIAGFLMNDRMTILETPADTVNGWYMVQKDNYTGYMQAGSLRVLTLGEAYAPTTAAPNQQAGYVRITKQNVNLRKTPGGESQTQIPIDTVLPYFGAPTNRAGYQWVYVLYEGTYGYVRGDSYTFSEANGSTITGPTSPPAATPQPGATQAPITGTGFIRLTKGGVNLRKTPGGESLTQMGRGEVLPYTGQPTLFGGYLWIYAQHDSGTLGYVRSDCYEFTDNAGTVVPTPTPQPGGIVGNIITTIGSLNVRSTPSLNASVLTRLNNSGVIFPYKGIVTGGGKQWYHIVYNNQSAYIVTTFATVTGASLPTTPPGGSTVTANPENLSSTAVTTMDRVLVRESGNGSSKILTTLYTIGSVAKLTGAVNQSGGYIWRGVTAGGVTGYIRGDLLRILTKTEETVLDNTGNPQLSPEASYPTLSRGATGSEVTRLQTELSQMGFLRSSAITGVYTDETVDAVKQFQLAAGLYIDGVAGSNTQHKLYKTVPEGTNNPDGTVDPNETYPTYPVEKANWRFVDTIWARDTTAVLTDVATGLSFRVKRWAGGSHADGEPLTAADTVVMCRIYGVANAQEIASKNLYERKPFWVTVAGHSFAASVYGVPHNYPDGDKIPNNNFNGQFCTHFVGSTTHTNPGSPDRDHQNAIQEAYDKAPSRK